MLLSPKRSQCNGLLLATLALAGCSRSSVTGPESDAASAAAPPTDPLERLRGLMSPAEHAALSGPRGVLRRAEGAWDGYTLVMPLVSTKVHLVDLGGEVVHTWETGHAPGGWCYLMDDGTLLHAARQDESPKFKGGGIGGIVRRLAPDGTVLWRYDLANDERCQHHDLEPLPNGNVLMIAWERVPKDEAIALGRRPELVGEVGLWMDMLLEVRPTPPLGGEVVWEWHAKDHLVQDYDPARPNFGKPAEHRGRIDLNFDHVPPAEQNAEAARAEAARRQAMAALGYGGGADEPAPPPSGPPPTAPPPHDWDRSGDWTHTNAVEHDAEHDLLVLSSPELCQIFVIDHSTTSAEAATEQGGRFGRGGALLWRWGNPAFEGVGGPAQKRLFYQHDPTWLPRAPGGPLRLLVFNNGGERPDGRDRSEVLELELPFDPAAGFSVQAGRPYGPVKPVWSYEDQATFFSAFISGARRLPNGNTLVCSGAPGRIFEVTPAGELVWDYYNPHGGDFEAPDHAGKAPPLALYRADRYAPDHPGIAVLLGR